MSTPTTFAESTAGKLFFVTGSNRGRDVFLGKAIGEAHDDFLTLEGKILSMTPQGRMIIRPFTTTMSVSNTENETSIHRLSNPQAREEATALLDLSATHIHRGAAPLVFAWVEGALGADGADSPGITRPIATARGVGVDPFYAFYESFIGATEEFRRVLFETRQVDSARELDHVTELEGDLLIEIGKITNRTAVKLNKFVQRQRGLAAHLDAFSSAPAPDASRSMGGWTYLFERMRHAKSWARKKGKVDLVRELNALIKDGVFGLNEVILDHGNALDTLITETFGQYGITHDFDCELTPAGAVVCATDWAASADPGTTRRGFDPQASAPTIAPAEIGI